MSISDYKCDLSVSIYFLRVYVYQLLGSLEGEFIWGFHAAKTL